MIIDDNSRVHIQVDSFDRDYELKDLLPRKTLEGLGREAHGLPARLAIYLPDGTPYFEWGDWDAAQKKALTACISKNLHRSEKFTEASNGFPSAIFPLQYEFETKGYLVVSTDGANKHEFSAWGKVIVGMFLKLMHLQHQTMMTSNLHGIVVHESYEQLAEKAAQLERSEEKYRHLAANLEIEVQKKTVEIKAAHSYLMQQEKLTAIGHLAAGMAHEINTPLGFMISNLNTLNDYVVDIGDLLAGYRKLAGTVCDGPVAGDDQLRARHKTVADLEKELDGDFLLNDMIALSNETLEGAQRIQKIVADLKKVARPGEKSRELIDVPESLNAVLTIINDRIGPHLSIVKDFGSVPGVQAVARELNQVWLHLLLNAVEATKGDGAIAIVTRAIDNHVSVTISDTGCGISEEHLSHIFDPFFTTKPVGDGTGMGLHLVYQVVHQHGGRITVASTPGQGSVFTVLLPIERS